MVLFSIAGQQSAYMVSTSFVWFINRACSSVPKIPNSRSLQASWHWSWRIWRRDPKCKEFSYSTICWAWTEWRSYWRRLWKDNYEELPAAEEDKNQSENQVKEASRGIPIMGQGIAWLLWGSINGYHFQKIVLLCFHCWVEHSNFCWEWTCIPGIYFGFSWHSTVYLLLFVDMFNSMDFWKLGL